MPRVAGDDPGSIRRKFQQLSHFWSGILALEC